VQLERVPQARLRLTVKDDGVGLKRDFQGGADVTLGLDLVAIFAKQLEAEVVVERDGGTSFQLTFEEESA
jgi:two-component sensor histidine kinase